MFSCNSVSQSTSVVIYQVDNSNQKIVLWLLQKPLGLISLLDEECTFPKASNVTLANKLKEHLKGNACFKGERSKAFRICHYAGEVGTIRRLIITIILFRRGDITCFSWNRNCQ